MADFLNDLKGKAKSAFDAVGDGISEGKKSFAKALVDATDMTPADMRAQPWAQQQKAEREALAETGADLLLPDQYDAMAPGIGKIGKVAKTVAKIADEGHKIYKAGSEAAKAAKAVPVIESTVKGFELLGKAPVKTAQNIGNVAVESTKIQKAAEAADIAAKNNTFGKNLNSIVSEAVDYDLSGMNRQENFARAMKKYSTDKRFLPEHMPQIEAALKKRFSL